MVSEIRILKKVEEKNSRNNLSARKNKAYIVDQLKHPGEVEVFRKLYQHNFYLFGVIREEQERKRNLRDEGIKDNEIDDLLHKDRKSENDAGQQTQKAILDADFFIRNRQSHKQDLINKAGRFINLIHGVNGLTPTKDERGMYAAFSASLQSACLSRQVGAAIFDEKENLLSIGKNDVPKAGGGLYSSDDSVLDHRCVHKGGKCYNDIRKNKIREKMESILEEHHIPKEKVSVLAEALYKETPISSLIEYSRSIHAEMDAIVSLSRNSVASSLGGVIYSTTFPCHNCARHILAAGLSRVVYIEPYDKSLALDLHDDAITKHGEEGKVVFDLFEGVSPRRYQKFFFSANERKTKEGIAKDSCLDNDNHIDVQYLDSYTVFETRIANDFMRKVNEAKVPDDL